MTEQKPNFKTWYWIASTKVGIFYGTLLGEQEQGEDDKQALESVAKVVRESLTKQLIQQYNVNIRAILVSESTILIDAPSTNIIPLDVSVDFPYTPDIEEPQVLQQTQAALSKLPPNYPKACVIKLVNGYALEVGRERVFGGITSGSETVKKVIRYVTEREKYPTLPIGVVDGIYD